LPDGIFSNQFGQILVGLRMENVGIFCANLEYIAAIWYILWSFGNFVAILYFFPFWYIVSRKIWQPCLSLLNTCDYIMLVRVAGISTFLWHIFMRAIVPWDVLSYVPGSIE
jgi:hypothetical protein